MNLSWLGGDEADSPAAAEGDEVIKEENHVENMMQCDISLSYMGGFSKNWTFNLFLVYSFDWVEPKINWTFQTAVVIELSESLNVLFLK